MKRGTATVTVFHQDVFGSLIDRNKYSADALVSVIEWLQMKLQDVPVEFRSTATFEIESEGGYEGEHHATATISYKRPETDEEMATRAAEERDRARRNLEYHEQAVARARSQLGS